MLVAYAHGLGSRWMALPADLRGSRRRLDLGSCGPRMGRDGIRPCAYPQVRALHLISGCSIGYSEKRPRQASTAHTAPEWTAVCAFCLREFPFGRGFGTCTGRGTSSRCRAWWPACRRCAPGLLRGSMVPGAGSAVAAVTGLAGVLVGCPSSGGSWLRAGRRAGRDVFGRGGEVRRRRGDGTGDGVAGAVPVGDLGQPAVTVMAWPRAGGHVAVGERVGQGGGRGRDSAARA